MDRKNLPISKINLDSNNVKLTAKSISKLKMDPALLKKLEQIQIKNSRVRKKKIY